MYKILSTYPNLIPQAKRMKRPDYYLQCISCYVHSSSWGYKEFERQKQNAHTREKLLYSSYLGNKNLGPFKRGESITIQ